MTRGLYLPRSSRVHRLPPECKVLAAVLFVLVVVATPPTWFLAFAGYALLLAVLTAAAQVPFRVVARRLVVELPFVVFALTLPFVAAGERVDVLGLSLSGEGLLAAFNLLTKATLGASTAILLAATTEVRELLRGLERLRLPRSFVAVLSFMVRYADVTVDEMQRMKVARDSRAYEPRNLLQLRALAASVGALFLRAYERGERVYLAMVSRGWSGAMPVLSDGGATGQQWSAALALPVAALGVVVTYWVAR